MLRRRPKPEDIISALYEEEGFYEIERGEDPDSGYVNRLILSDGRREIIVNILDEDIFAIRGAIQDALLQAEKLKGKFDGVAIAIPRKYQRAVDEDVMALHGFGLIIYDNLGAEEIIPPKIREGIRSKKEEERELDRSRSVREEEIIQLRRDFSRILKALEEIEARLDRLEKEQNKLIKRINDVENKLRELSKAEPRIREEIKATPKTISRVKVEEGLPSYLVDNPWIEILSRRE